MGNVQKGRPARPQSFPTFVAKGYFGGVGLARGAYTEYISTPKARERSWLVCRSLGEGWRPFSTFPEKDRKIWPLPAPSQQIRLIWDRLLEQPTADQRAMAQISLRFC